MELFTPIRFALNESSDQFSIALTSPQIDAFQLSRTATNAVLECWLDSEGLHLVLHQGSIRWRSHRVRWSKVWSAGGEVFRNSDALRELQRISKLKPKRKRGERGPEIDNAEADFILSAAILESIESGVGVTRRGLDNALAKYPPLAKRLIDRDGTGTETLRKYISRQLKKSRDQ